MPFLCPQPPWALCAAAILLAAAALWFAMRRFSRRWRLAAIVLPAAAAICAALALSGLTLRVQGPVAIILDFSPSARTSPWHDPQWVRDLAARRLPPVVRLTIVGDDGGQRRVLLADISAAEGWPGAFNWDASPPVTAALPRQQWLISDGLIAPPATLPAAVSIVRPVPIDLGVRDMVVRSIEVTAETHSVEVLVQLRATGLPAAAVTKAATLEIERDGRTIAAINKEFVAASGVPLDAAAWVTIRDRLSPDESRQPHRYTAVLNRDMGPRGDPWPENDRGVLYWPGASQQPRVLTIGSEPGGQVRLLTGQFHRDASQLAAEGWQAIILEDVPAMESGSLSTAQAQALDRFVRDTGGGLLIASRSRAFGPGRYGEGEGAPDILEALSPVWSRPPEGSAAGIIFVLDASASMNEAAGAERKFSLLARAIEEAVRYAGANDSLAVISFNREAQLLSRGRVRETLAGLSAKLRGVSPQGETAPDSALNLLGDTLRMPEFRDPAVIFLTDGEIPSLDAARWKQALGPAPLVVVAPTSGVPPVTPLQQLALATNARWQRAATPAAWQTLLPQLVLDKTRGRLRQESLDWRAAELAGLAPSWTETWLKPEAQLLAEGLKLNSPSRIPVAAIAQRGLGKVAALMIPDDGAQAYGALQAQLLQKILAPAGDRRFRAEVRRQPDGLWLIRADAVDGGTFLNGASLSAKVLTGADAAETLPLRQTGPGRYEASASAQGALAAVITRGTEGAGGEQQLVARVQAPDVQIAEFPASVDEPWVPQRAVAAIDSSEPLQFESLHGLGPWLWVMAAGMALAALWLRM